MNSGDNIHVTTNWMVSTEKMTSGVEVHDKTMLLVSTANIWGNVHDKTVWSF